MADTASEGAEKTGTKQNGVWSATLVKFYAMFMTPIGIIITIELSVTFSNQIPQPLSFESCVRAGGRGLWL